MQFQKLKHHYLGLGSVLILTIFALISVFAYVLSPDKSSNANMMHLSIASKPIGFKATLLCIPRQKSKQSYFQTFFMGVISKDNELPIAAYRFSKDTLHIQEYTDGIIDNRIEKKIPLSVFPKSLSNLEITKKYILNKRFILGTDKYGRDFLSRILVGTRVSFFVGIIAVIISLLIGIPVGAFSGYYGGKTDAFVMWVINVVWSIPTLLLVVAITLILGKGFWQVFVAVGLTMWVEVARVIRGQIMSEKHAPYIFATRALGYSDIRIIFRHICPNVMTPIIVVSATNFSSAILIESGLSFLGIGAQPPIPSWGNIIKEHYNHIIIGEPHLAIIPGIAIMLLVMASMILGNTLRDSLDLKGSSK